MPSVRIKRNHDDYASLRDDAPPAPNRRRSQTLASLFSPNAPELALPSNPSDTRRRAGSASLSVPGPTRPGPGNNPYGTLPRQPSRVTDHILRGSVRSIARSSTLREELGGQQLIQKAPSGSDASYRRDGAGNYLIEGAQETIAMRENPMHSRIGSAVSLLSEDDGTHHEDEVVEHLDVIGTFTSILNGYH
jgi:hypothetical protein